VATRGPTGRILDRPQAVVGGFGGRSHGAVPFGIGVGEAGRDPEFPPPTEMSANVDTATYTLPTGEVVALSPGLNVFERFAGDQLFLVATVLRVVWAVSDASADEGDDLTFTLTRTDGGPDIAATWSTVDGTAVAGTDYVAQSAVPLTVGGVDSIPLVVASLSNGVDVGDLTMGIQVSSAGLDALAGTGTIVEVVPEDPTNSLTAVRTRWFLDASGTTGAAVVRLQVNSSLQGTVHNEEHSFGAGADPDVTVDVYGVAAGEIITARYYYVSGDANKIAVSSRRVYATYLGQAHSRPGNGGPATITPGVFSSETILNSSPTFSDLVIPNSKTLRVTIPAQPWP